MASEPKKPIEQMLEALAKARRAEFGDDPKMPNPMRARLHEEIARTGAAEDEKVESRAIMVNNVLATSNSGGGIGNVDSARSGDLVEPITPSRRVRRRCGSWAHCWSSRWAKPRSGVREYSRKTSGGERHRTNSESGRQQSRQSRTRGEAGPEAGLKPHQPACSKGALRLTSQVK